MVTHCITIYTIITHYVDAVSLFWRHCGRHERVSRRISCVISTLQTSCGGATLIRLSFCQTKRRGARVRLFPVFWASSLLDEGSSASHSDGTLLVQFRGADYDSG